jgi:hypothetical protein
MNEPPEKIADEVTPDDILDPDCPTNGDTEELFPVPLKGSDDTETDPSLPAIE